MAAVTHSPVIINFITGQPKGNRSGGFSALSAAVFDALRSVGETHYVGPIAPPIIAHQKFRSKLLRILGGKGAFFFFSRARLTRIAQAVNLTAADLDVFHGFTPWIATRPSHPYLALSDCTFRDYMNVFHLREKFADEDLIRIEQSEATWLKQARLVLFTSEWAARRAISDYGLNEACVKWVGIFGAIEEPLYDAYAGGNSFAFISTDFEAKGGAIALAAFREIRRWRPDISLFVVGDAPVGLKEPGVEVMGFLRKEIAGEHERLCSIFTSARALIHPTRSDISPHLIVEAGYFGCPVISSRRFAIPELIDDNVSGVLLDDPADVGALASAMMRLLEDGSAYQAMRRATWHKARAQHSRAAFEKRVADCVGEALL